jgi:hypothetical protein
MRAPPKGTYAIACLGATYLTTFPRQERDILARLAWSRHGIGAQKHASRVPVICESRNIVGRIDLGLTLRCLGERRN